MSYVRDNLLPSERVLFEARIHPAVYLAAGISGLGALFFFIAALAAGRGQDASGGLLAGFQLCLSGMFIVLTVVTAVQAFLHIMTTEFAVTDKRVIAKSGFIRRRTVEMLLSKVESVVVRQNIAGRLLDFGTVTVIGTGGTREGFRGIQAPMALRTRINQILQDHGTATT